MNVLIATQVSREGSFGKFRMSVSWRYRHATIEIARAACEKKMARSRHRSQAIASRTVWHACHFETLGFSVTHSDLAAHIVGGFGNSLFFRAYMAWFLKHQFPPLLVRGF